MNTASEAIQDNAMGVDLNPDLKVHNLRTDFQAHHRLRIANILTDQAALQFYDRLSSQVRWKTLLVADGKMFAGPSHSADTPLNQADNELAQRAGEATSRGYASFFEADHPFWDDLQLAPPEAKGDIADPMEQIAEFFNAPAFLTLVRSIMDLSTIDAATVQARRLRSGHFATFSYGPIGKPNSGAPCACFTLNLTPEWRAEWGGFLEFRSDRGRASEGYIPTFNALDLFALPQGHWISAVAPFADCMSLAISGRLYASKTVRREDDVKR